MGHVRLLVILLVVATLLVDLVVVSVVASHQIVPTGRPHPGVDALSTLCIAQVGLVAIWTGFGGKSLPWRILALILTIGLWSRLLAWTDDFYDDASVVNACTCLLVAQSIVILIPLGALRLRGVRLVRSCDEHPSEQVAPARGPLQFSLGHLLSWITVVGVVLGLAQYTLEFEELMGLLSANRWVLPVVAVGHGGLVLAGLWAVLGTARLRLRWLVALVAVAGTIVATLLWPGHQDPLTYSGLCLVQVLWVVGSLSVFRVAGYRMTRLSRGPRIEAEQPPASPDPA